MEGHETVNFGMHDVRHSTISKERQRRFPPQSTTTTENGTRAYE